MGAAETITFAAVPYANAAPLAHFLPEVRAGVQGVYAPPSALAGQLARGEADAALVPVADFLADSSLKMVDGIGICADGAVWSVRLKCQRPIEQIRTIARDAASRTSNALAEILLREHFGVPVEMTDDVAGADAAVLIGDRALRDPPGPCGDVDLGACWKEFTGLGFVFAVWAYRADHPHGSLLAKIAGEAKTAGCAAIDSLARMWAGKLALPEDRCRDYLSRAIVYDLGPRQAAGMKLFGRLLEARRDDG